MKKNLKALEAAVMTSINNNVVPVMKNIDGLLPITEQIMRVMPSNLGYAYEKMNLIIDNAFIENRLRTLIDEINEMRFSAYYTETFEENAERMLKEFSNKYPEFTPMDAYVADKFEICDKAPGEKCWNGGEYGFYSVYNASPVSGVYYVTTYTTCDIDNLGTGFEGVEYVSKDRYKELREMEAEILEEAEREYDRAHGYEEEEEEKMAKINEVMENIEKRYLENENCFQEFCETITGKDLANLTLVEIVELYGALSNKIDGDVVIRENIQDDVYVEMGKTVLGSKFSAENSLKERVDRFEQWLSYEHECDCDLCVDSQTSGEDVDVNYAHREQTTRIDKAFNAIVKQGEEPFTTSADEDCPF